MKMLFLGLQLVPAAPAAGQPASVRPAASEPSKPAAAQAPVLAIGLMPGAARALGLHSVEGAAQALQVPFEDPLVLRLQPAGETAAGLSAQAGPTHSTPANCSELLALEARITGPQPASDWVELRQRLSDCHALRWLTRATQPVHTALPAHAAALRPTRLWPATLWPVVSPDERAAAGARPGDTLREASGRARWALVAPNELLQLTGASHTVRLQWLARADFDGDGWEDLLVRWQAQATGGSWRDVRTLVLTRTQPGALRVLAELPVR